MNHQTADHVEVLIIGAGVAGATAALSAAQSGARRVLLVDRCTWPRDKVCGCCLGSRGLDALEAVGIHRDSLLARGHALREVHIRCGAQTVQLALPGGVVISRRVLDELLVDRAVASRVQFIPRCSARIAPRSPGAPWSVVLSNLADERTSPRVIRANTVIVADGLAGRSLEQIAGPQLHVSRRARMGVGASAHCGQITAGNAAEALPPGRVVLCTGRGGYVGLVRLQGGSVDVAAALDPGRIKSSGGPAVLVSRILASAGLTPEFHWPIHYTGTPLLTRRRFPVALDGLLIIGDAAGYVEPFTGEGMTWAACGGLMAGQFAARQSPTSAGDSWNHWHAANLRAQQRTCQATTTALRVPGFARAAAWLIGRSEVARLGAAQIAASLGRPAADCDAPRNLKGVA